jgi:hypothetical protein
MPSAAESVARREYLWLEMCSQIVIIALSRFIAELQINILFKRILCDTRRPEQ